MSSFTLLHQRSRWYSTRGVVNRGQLYKTTSKNVFPLVVIIYNNRIQKWNIVEEQINTGYSQQTWDLTSSQRIDENEALL